MEDALHHWIPLRAALNNALWFEYDALDRLIEKRQTNSIGNKIGEDLLCAINRAVLHVVIGGGVNGGDFFVGQ